ncbi:hypothetical protein [Spirosoma foliorum]|uniref:Uncharacterized protein n=1 Tax=Spirosoma foliorum TaxID=2710596 RepID=A0A7G5GYW3_9BACT|nr:hypothetical protein [Spirosoma foliorum]QMW04055.1 hypothetical protein H3H32_03610 [Spirosoma foliorum]
METITITLEQYVNTFPDGEKWYFSSPGLKKLEPAEDSMISALRRKCEFKGQEINIPRICKNVVDRAQKGILPKPYHLLYVASCLIRKAPFISYTDAFELVMWHVVQNLNERYKADKIPLILELGEKEKVRAGIE